MDIYLFSPFLSTRIPSKAISSTLEKVLRGPTYVCVGSLFFSFFFLLPGIEQSSFGTLRPLWYEDCDRDPLSFFSFFLFCKTSEKA